MTNVEKSSLFLHHFWYIKGFILRRNLASVMSVGNPLANVSALINLKEFRLERKPVNASNVGKHLVINQNLHDIRKLTMVRSPTNESLQK